MILHLKDTCLSRTLSFSPLGVCLTHVLLWVLALLVKYHLINQGPIKGKSCTLIHLHN